MLVRLLKIYYKEENKQKYKLSILGNIDGIKERNIKIEFNKSENNLIKLFGYDRELKYEKNDLNFQEIFAIIDDMPMRKLEMRKLEMMQSGGDMNLYNDERPLTTIKNTGFKDKKTAKNTIKMIKKRSLMYQKALVNALYNRAKFHQHKTEDIKEAMKVFKDWLDKNKDKNEKYNYLDLDIVKFYEKVAKLYDISHVSRGLKKSTKSQYGFTYMYKKLKSRRKLAFTPIFKKKPDGDDYDTFREKFLNSRLGQIKKSKDPLFYKEGKYKGLPTKQHIILIMYAYSPSKKITDKKYMNKIEEILKNID